MGGQEEQPWDWKSSRIVGDMVILLHETSWFARGRVQDRRELAAECAWFYWDPAFYEVLKRSSGLAAFPAVSAFAKMCIKWKERVLSQSKFQHL